LMKQALVLLVVVALAAGLPTDLLPESQNLLGDAPSLTKKPTAPMPDADGLIKEEVVNVNKKAVVFIKSTQTEEGAKRRQLLRDTWMQSLNRTSDMTLPRDQRRSVAVWFYVIRDPSLPLEKQPVYEEGQKNGDLSFITAPEGMDHFPTPVEEMGALMRWVRVAYFERYDYVLVTDDDAFISVGRLLSFCDSNMDKPFFYSGFVNSFERAPEDYQHKYFAPFAQQGTIVLSRKVVELVAREIGLIRPLARGDTTLGHFLFPYMNGKPVHDGRFVANIKNVYSEIADPIVVKGVSPEVMMALARGEPLPAQTEEMKTRGMFIDPHPKDDFPECDSIEGVSRCNLPKQ